MSVDPEQTIAVVVAIEHYDADKDSRLDGPTSDGCRFVDWLISRGVPPGNITLLASPLQENAQLVNIQSARGVQIADARAETIRERLITRLPTESSGLLIIHWGGHGVVDERGQRKLIYPDAQRHDPRNFNLTSLLTSLRTDTFRNHPCQQIVIDTCSAFMKEPRQMGWRAKLPDEQFPSGTLVSRDQSVYFATSDGEYAINSDARKTGYFSEAILEALQTLPDDEWPPDLDVVSEEVNAKFDTLRAERKTRQVPSKIWYKARSCEKEVLIFDTDAKSRSANAQALGIALLDDTEHKRLRKILRGACAPDNVSALYREASRSVDLPPLLNPDDLRSIVDTLRKPMSGDPLFEFLVRFANGAADKVTSSRLWEWIDEVGPRYNVDLDRLRALDEQLRRTYLLVKLEADPIGAGYEVTVWRYIGDEGRQTDVSPQPWDRSKLAEVISNRLASFDPDFPPVVEFLIPTGMVEEEFEKLPVQVNGEQIEVGSACPVVVRPLERRERHHWRKAHENAWLAVGAHDSYDHAAICWIDHFPAENSILVGHVCAALAFTCQEPRAEAVMHCLFDAGTPIALWHRSGRPTGRVLLNRVLKGQAIVELPDVVHEQRCNSGAMKAAADHPGRDLVLLWDDPTRAPDNQDWQLPTLMEGAAS